MKPSANQMAVRMAVPGRGFLGSLAFVSMSSMLGVGRTKCEVQAEIQIFESRGTCGVE